MSEPIWTYRTFDQLSPLELYRIIELRNRVFVVEQNCVYNDTDEKDLQCLHLCCWHEGKLLAYARLVPPGLSYEEASIGRVVCDPAERGRGLGKELMERAIELCRSLFQSDRIRISAQSYLIDFYVDIGFTATGKEYLEDGIPHTEMIIETL